MRSAQYTKSELTYACLTRAAATCGACLHVVLYVRPLVRSAQPGQAERLHLYSHVSLGIQLEFPSRDWEIRYIVKIDYFSQLFHEKLRIFMNTI